MGFHPVMKTLNFNFFGLMCQDMLLKMICILPQINSSLRLATAPYSTTLMLFFFQMQNLIEHPSKMTCAMLKVPVNNEKPISLSQPAVSMVKFLEEQKEKA